MAWVTTQDGRLLSIDLADPSGPVIRGSLTLGGAGFAIARISRGFLAIAERSLDGTTGDLEVVETSDLAAPSHVADAALGSTNRSVLLS